MSRQDLASRRQAAASKRRAAALPRLVRGYAPVAALALVLAAVPVALAGQRYYLSLAVGFLVLSGYGIGLNVVFGASGQLFLCLGALAGLSGYTAALASERLGVPPVAGVLAGTALATAVGAALSAVTVRRGLSAMFTGVVTLAFALAFTSLAVGLRGLTGGETGLVVADGGLLAGRRGAYAVLAAVVVGCLVAHRLVQRSRLGWALRALRDDETAAALAGIDVARCKVAAAAIGAAMLGVVGALHAYHEGFVSPATYAFDHVDVRALVAVAFGGLGTLAGPVVGAAVLSVVDEVLRPAGQLRLSVYGVVLVVLFLFFRDGLVPAVARAARRAAAATSCDSGGHAPDR